MKNLIVSWFIMIVGIMVSFMASNSLQRELLLAVAIFSALWFIKIYQNTTAHDN
ncbi:MAG: hypothetical protein ACKN86_01040 [Crocinitomicaceae bacterium]|jgi:hypothetical protein